MCTLGYTGHSECAVVISQPVDRNRHKLCYLIRLECSDVGKMCFEVPFTNNLTFSGQDKTERKLKENILIDNHAFH